jgi:AcrR family transcriptional regulator
MDAMARVVAERGFRGVTVERVNKRAGVSRVTFYECFENIEACFLATLDAAMRRATALVVRELECGGPWPERVAGGLAALLGFLDDEPALARVCLVEVLAAGPAALAYRARELEVLKHAVDIFASEAGAHRRASLLSAEAAIAAVAGILHARLVAGEAPPFMDLLAPLTGVALAPYLNTRALAHEVRNAEQLARALGSARSPERATLPSGLSNPGAHKARLCLFYLAEHPGASNRAVAERIGVSHEGQVSALLARLARQGLLTKRAGGPGRANAWRLTEHGECVARSLVGWRASIPS